MANEEVLEEGKGIGGIGGIPGLATALVQKSSEDTLALMGDKGILEADKD